MTQLSEIQAGNKLVTPALTDSGPYSAQQWAYLWRSGLSVDGPSSGVLPTWASRLFTTRDSAVQITVQPGRALVGGHFFSSDANVVFNVASALASTRYDRVVVVQNNTDVAVTAGVVSGATLTFPTVLTDYAGLASIPAHTARLAILRGTEGANAPALDDLATGLQMLDVRLLEVETTGVAILPADTRMYAGVGVTLVADTQVLVANTNLFLPETYASFGFSGLSAYPFQSYRLVLKARVGSGSTGVLRMLLNADSSALYQWEHQHTNNATGVVSAAGAAATSIELGRCIGTTGTANVFDQFVIDFVGCELGMYTTLRSMSTYRDTAGGARWIQNGAAWYDSTSALDTIQIFATPSALALGTRAMLYGLM